MMTDGPKVLGAEHEWWIDGHNVFCLRCQCWADSIRGGALCSPWIPVKLSDDIPFENTFTTPKSTP